MTQSSLDPQNVIEQLKDIHMYLNARPVTIKDLQMIHNAILLLEQFRDEIDQLKQQLKPTLFWDDNCPEEGYGDPEDCADYYDNEDEVIITIKQGVMLPNNCYVAAWRDKDGLQQKETCNTYEEAEAVIAKAKAVQE